MHQARPVAGMVPRAASTLVMVAALAVVSAHAQDSDVRVQLGGLLQAETDYGWVARGTDADERSRLGFGLRRARLRVGADIGPKAGAFVHLDADGGTFGVLDAFLSYQATPRLRLRLGRMASAQPRAFILTPVVAMDTNERAAISLLWHQGTLGHKGRDFGVDMHYVTRTAEAMLFLHNGYGSYDNLFGNYQPNIVGDVTRGREHTLSDLAVSFYGAFRPTESDLEIGGFLGHNGSENPNTAVFGQGRSYFSYAAHAYLGALPGSRPFRLKADLIGVHYESTSLRPPQNTLGASLLAAIAVHRSAEAFGRLEYFDPDTDVEGSRNFFPTVGVSFSPSRLHGRPYAQERITLAYNARVPEEDDDPLHQLLVLQVQFNF